MNERSFENKWAAIAGSSAAEKQIEESDIFVPKNSEPQTQRQLNLYYYFQFVDNILRKTNARKTLEIGCGRGTLSLYLSEYLGLNVSLLDDSQYAIDVAKRLFKKHNQPAQFYVGDALKTDFKNASFDSVVSIGLAEHLDNVEDLFSEQYRVLKPGGVMVSLNIPKKFSVQSLNTVMRFIKKITGGYKDDVKKDYYRNSFTTKEYISKARQAGFVNISITNVAPFPLYTPVNPTTDVYITDINKIILKVRSLFMKYPYKTNKIASQAHFLVAYK